MGRLWLRDETKPHERRTPLLPEHAADLVGSGHTVVVERSQTRVVDDSAYAAAGCRVVPPGTWVDAPDDYFVLGLKELPTADFPLRHRHIYYAHCYKQQRHARQLLRRFRDGGGTLLDSEYLTDTRGAPLTVDRIGWLSGYVGAAMALQFYSQKILGLPLRPAVPYFSERSHLVSHTRMLAERAAFTPSLVIIGYRGNAGSGARQLCEDAGTEPTLWGRPETAAPEVLATLNRFEVVVNCIQADEEGTPFLQETDLDTGSRLSVLADVTCDVGSPAHRFPFYSRITTFDDPVLTAGPEHARVDVIAIDHLTTWLPLDASRLIAEPLYIQLKALLGASDSALPGPWHRTRERFLEEMRNFG